MLNSLIIFFGYIIGQSLGYDDNLEFWLESTYEFTELENINFFEKEYGYFRVLIDNDIDDDTIISIRKIYVKK